MVRAPGGEPVAKMRVDYTSESGTGVFSQLATMGPLQGLGIATMLIGVGDRHPVMVQATCTFIPVALRFPEYSSGCALHDQHGSSVPSTM